ncbi:single-stranded DNA-binding protein [Nocardioides sambongensis]|uniref:single-stranded DNA-binding protein n=1 Tax=Nocardioides sambongensis TaxID=2589074 RepID=UPI00112EC8BC|nr:single-stranded DNA-binding protein [Nocardioides sambongensis]
MSIPTQMSLTGFIASPPEIHFSESGTARMHARIGCEHYRKETDGSFTKLDPTFHDLVVFGDTALKAYERFRKGDAFLASGYIHEYEVPAGDTTRIKEQFVAHKIGHDTNRTRYDVQRRTTDRQAPQPTRTPHHPAQQRPAVGL